MTLLTTSNKGWRRLFMPNRRQSVSEEIEALKLKVDTSQQTSEYIRQFHTPLNPMRLSTDQIQAIRHAANTAFGDGTAVWLFGSRVDDAKKIRMLTLLERLLGERKIDLVVEQTHDTRPIVNVAHSTGIRIQ